MSKDTRSGALTVVQSLKEEATRLGNIAKHVEEKVHDKALENQIGSLRTQCLTIADDITKKLGKSEG
jgi:hypothetical protein